MIPGGLMPLMMGGLNQYLVNWLAALDNQPTSARITLLNTFFDTLQAGGLFNKLDFLQLLGGHDAQAGHVNMVNPSQELLLANSPTFATDGGYTGSTSAYLYTPFNLDALTHFSQDSNHIGVWIGSNVTTNAGDVGVVGYNGFQVIGRQGTVVDYYVNAGTNRMSGTTGSSIGHVIGNRIDSGTVVLYKDGADLSGSAVGSQTSATVPGNPLAICRGASTSGGRQIRAVHGGSELTAGEITTLYNALNTLFSSY
jgi:hypothetical protein